jgi:hypothetical protein
VVFLSPSKQIPARFYNQTATDCFRILLDNVALFAMLTVSLNKPINMQMCFQTKINKT